MTGHWPATKEGMRMWEAHILVLASKAPAGPVSLTYGDLRERLAAGGEEAVAELYRVLEALSAQGSI